MRFSESPCRGHFSSFGIQTSLPFLMELLFPFGESHHLQYARLVNLALLHSHHEIQRSISTSFYQISAPLVTIGLTVKGQTTDPKWANVTHFLRVWCKDRNKSIGVYWFSPSRCPEEGLSRFRGWGLGLPDTAYLFYAWFFSFVTHVMSSSIYVQTVLSFN